MYWILILQLPGGLESSYKNLHTKQCINTLFCKIQTFLLTSCLPAYVSFDYNWKHWYSRWPIHYVCVHLYVFDPLSWYIYLLDLIDDDDGICIDLPREKIMFPAITRAFCHAELWLFQTWLLSCWKQTHVLLMKSLNVLLKLIMLVEREESQYTGSIVLSQGLWSPFDQCLLTNVYQAIDMALPLSPSQYERLIFTCFISLTVIHYYHGNVVSYAIISKSPLETQQLVLAWHWKWHL